MRATVSRVAFSAGILFAGSAMAGSPPLASPQSQNFQVLLSISDECQVGTIADLDFTPVAGVGFLTSDLMAQTTINVGCTKGTIATVALSDGGNFAAGTRRMTNGADFVAYDLYTDNTYVTVWNGTNTRQVTGDGVIAGASPALNQPLVVYGKVPAQNTGGAGSYSDSITATVTF